MATLTPFVQPGMTVFEPGPGMGFFTLEMARMAGRHGRIIAVDIQPKMLSALGRRVGRKGLSDRIEFRLADGTGMVETELFAQTYKSYGLATVRYPVLEVEACVEPFENGRGFSLRVLRAGKPRPNGFQSPRL